MLGSRSPPTYKQLVTGTGGSNSAKHGSNASSSTSGSKGCSLSGHHYQQAYVGHSHACYHHHQQQQQQVQQVQHHHHHSHSHGSRTSLTPTMKRGKKNWGSRERSSMSFLIVILFFAVFGLIILTEVSRVGKGNNLEQRKISIYLRILMIIILL